MKNAALFTSDSTEWETPQALFDELNKEFHFNLDPCATKQNAKCKKFYTKKDDGLVQDWKGKRVFCNPPYGKYTTPLWIKKCATSGAAVCVALIPSRTDTRWFHEYIYGKAEIRFVKGRLHFSNSKDAATFPSMIVIWRKK